jgi:hypothetical protein
VAGPYGTAPMPLRHPPGVTRRQERERPHAWRLRLSSRVLGRGRRGRVGRRARWALRHQPARGRAKRQRPVSSAESNMIAPRRARDARAARASDAHARAAGLGARRPVGRRELPAFFSHVTNALTAQWDTGMAGENRGECLTTPRGRAGAVLAGGLVDEALAVGCQRTGPCGGATGAGASHQALAPWVGAALDPLAQGRRGKVQRVGHRGEAVPLDDCAPGVGTAEDPGRLGLLAEGIQGGESLSGTVECEGPPSRGLQEKLRQQCTGVHGSWLLLSEQNLFDSNFSGAAHSPDLDQNTRLCYYPYIAQGMVTQVEKGLQRASRRLIPPLFFSRCDDVWIELPKAL